MLNPSITGGRNGRFQGIEIKDCRVLELGTGPGAFAVPLAEVGCFVHSIDISEKSLEMARIKVHKHHVQDRVTLEIMNAEDLTFPDESFDVVCGMGILHHLALKAAMPEIRRVLKPNGRAVFLEPMGHNPAIQLFRTLTPKLRTPDEHPLKARDLKSMASLFRNLDARFFYLASLMAVPFRKTPVFESVRSALHRVDDWILSWPVVKNLAWVVVFTLEK